MNTPPSLNPDFALTRGTDSPVEKAVWEQAADDAAGQQEGLVTAFREVLAEHVGALHARLDAIERIYAGIHGK